MDEPSAGAIEIADNQPLAEVLRRGLARAIDALTEQRVAAAVQEERERCAKIADHSVETYRALYILEGFPEDLKRKDVAEAIAYRIRAVADRPAPEGSADLARPRCSTPSQEDEATRQKRSRDAQSQQGLAPSVFERPPSSTQPGCGMGWLPIDTYPREWEPGAETWWGSNVLLFVPTGEVAPASDYRILTGRLEADAWLGWGDDGSMYDISGKPTHWQRLPSPPNVARGLSSASNTDPSPQITSTPSQEDTGSVSGPMVERVAAALDATPNLFLRVNKGRADGYPHEICWPGEPIVVIAAYRDHAEAVSRRGQLQLRAYASAAIAVMSSPPTDAGGPGTAPNTDAAQEKAPEVSQSYRALVKEMQTNPCIFNVPMVGQMTKIEGETTQTV